MTGIATFRCRALACWLSRAACAEKHARFLAAAQTELGKEGHVGAQCVKCELGAQHRDGAEPECWPDGELVQLRVLRSPSSSSTSAPLTEERSDPATSSPPKPVLDRPAPRSSVTAPPPRSEERTDREASNPHHHVSDRCAPRAADVPRGREAA